jgi:diguanylate cyclase (GGDEF)-like protein/PAS domain S-box-containing protein
MLMNINNLVDSNVDKLHMPDDSNQYLHLIDKTPTIIFVHQEGRIVFANQRAIQTLGTGDTSLIGKTIDDLVVPEFQDKIKEQLDRDLLPNRDGGVIECKLLSLDGKAVFLETTGTLVTFNGRPAVMVVGHDITEKKELQEQYLESEQRYRALFEQSANAVYSMDAKGFYTRCNKASEKLTGYRWTGNKQSMHFLDLVNPLEKEKALTHFQECLKGVSQNFQISFLCKDGSLLFLNNTLIPIIKDRKIEGIIGISTDMTEQVIKDKANEHMAYHDYLTGLPNRNMLSKHLSTELSGASEKKENVALLFIDLDRFKNINDSLGHKMGDLLLREVAKRLKSFLYETDMVFRQGGDEFIVVLSNADRIVAAKIAQRILDSLSSPFNINSYDIFTSPSIGISVFPEDGTTAETLIKHADFAMYQAKKSGKNNFTFYSSDTHILLHNPLKVEMELHRAIERNELQLYYQPKVNLKTGKIVGVEALLRWFHPLFGSVPPATFIPIAEETGLIIPIGEWVLLAACLQNKQWHRKGFETVVSVNLSSRQFSLSNLETTIEKILLETELDPKYLEIEITESMTADIDRTITTLRKLKRLGVRISIDDFGIGFSSLNYLRQFPIDTLKIDQSFVKQIHHNPNDETIVKTIISMAHNLNLNVVAEGIETKEQLIFLQQYLCDEGQGFFFTRPLPADKLEGNLGEIQTRVREFGLPEETNERMWAEEMVRQAERELNETIRLQQGMIFKYKMLDGRFIHSLCDGELVYRMGLTPIQIVGKELCEFLPKEMSEEKEEFYRRAWNGEEYVTYENELNGIHSFIALSPVKRGGEVIEVIGSSIDITERKQMERDLEESQKNYRLIADNMTDLIAVLDRKGQSLYISPSHEAVLGYPKDYYKDRHSFTDVHHDDNASLLTLVEQIIATNLPVKSEVRYLHRNGDWKLLECSGTPVIGDDGEVEHMIIVSRDITEKRRAEEQLAKAEKLQVVGELAAGVAHEIRNPITAIKGFIQLFQRGVIKDEYFEVILGEFNRIEEIITEFLSLAKTQEMKPNMVNIPILLNEVVTLLASEANLMNIQISTEMDQDVPQIICDPNQLKQVFINIIKNSIESITSDGLITIGVSTEENYLSVKVSDNGIGISEERVQRLGEPFYSNKEKGTGLGLTTSFRIIKQHNGTITFKSKENQGTTVEVTLPR